MAAHPPATPPRRFVTCPADIAALARELRLLGRAGPKVEVRLPGLGADENRALAADIDRQLSACGCGQGRVSGIVTMTAYVGLCFAGVISVSELGIGRTVLLYFLCAGVAMFATRLVTRWRARRTLHALADRFGGDQLPAATGRGG